MSLRDVVRQDVRAAVRSRSALSAVLVLLAAIVGPAVDVLERPFRDGSSLFVNFVDMAVLLTRLAGPGGAPGTEPAALSTGDYLVVALGFVLAWVVPILVLQETYDAVAVERRSGTVKHLLGLPNSRFDAMAGKVVARSGVVVAGVLVSVAGVCVVGATSELSVGVGRLAGFAGLVALLAVCFAAFGVAASTLTERSRRAMSASFGVFLLFAVVWRPLQFAALWLTTARPLPVGAFPEWFYLTSRLNPIAAFRAATTMLLDPGSTHPLVAYAPAGSLYAEPWLPVAVLVGWTVVAFGVGYGRFRRIDIH